MRSRLPASLDACFLLGTAAMHDTGLGALPLIASAKIRTPNGASGFRALPETQNRI